MGRPVKYTPKEIKWIVKNYGKIPVSEMAAKYHATTGAFRRFVSGLRSAGHKIHKELPRPPLPVGTIVERARREGYIRKYQKQKDGSWLELKTGRFKGRPKTTDAGKKNKYTRKAPRKPKVSAPVVSKLFVTPAAIKKKAAIQHNVAKVKIPLPGGSFVVCDEDKVEATVRYLLKHTG